MSNYCIPKHLLEPFLTKVNDGTLDPARLSKMTSAERRAAFAKELGDTHAQRVNAEFESKLLLKNQQAGLENWVKQTGGLKPEVQRDMLARVQRMDRVLEPKEMDAFLSDLAAQKLGFGVTMEEAGKISELAKTVSEAKAKAGFDPKTGVGSGDRLAYGRALYDFGTYVADLKNAVPVSKGIGARMNDAAGASKALSSWGDNSALFRQGSGMMFAHPKVWAKNALQSWNDLWKSGVKGEDIMREAMADILSRPNAINGRYRKAKLALGNVEEAFPTDIGEKIPIIKRPYKASQDAFTLFQYRNRADAFDLVTQVAEKANSKPETRFGWNRHADLSDTAELESIGAMINSLTARGDLGHLEPIASVVNNVFFSGRKMAGDFDMLTAHTFRSNVTPFVRRQAAENLAMNIIGAGIVLTVANMLKPGSVTPDLLSADALKVKDGDTRFDPVTGGKGSMVILAARVAAILTERGAKMLDMESPVDGAKYENSSLFTNFFANKLSPAARLVKLARENKDRDRKAVDWPTELLKSVTPMGAWNLKETADASNGANVMLAFLADFVGIGSNTYSMTSPDLPDRALVAMKKLGIAVPKAPSSVLFGTNPHTREKVEIPDNVRAAWDKQFAAEAGPIIEQVLASPDFTAASTADQWEMIKDVIAEVRKDQMKALKDSITAHKKP